MAESLRLGVDLGGTKTEAVVVRSAPDREPEVLARKRVPTFRDGGYDHVVSTVAALVGEVTAEAGLREPPPIGVGMPGSITFRTPDGERSTEPLVKNSNTTCLNGRPFRRDLVARVGRPIAFDNDANCFALAEATFGAGREARVVFGVIMGTGVGGGIALATDRPSAGAVVRTWSGAQGIAGEWGHVALEPRDGPPCYCGRRGCVETYLSGPAIERAYREKTGRALSLREIAASSDPHARETLDEVAQTFGRALATVLNVLDPDVVVLGGGVSNLDVLYDRGVAAVARWLFDDELRTPIVRNVLGDSAGVLGAAMLP